MRTFRQERSIATDSSFFFCGILQQKETLFYLCLLLFTSFNIIYYERHIIFWEEQHDELGRSGLADQVKLRSVGKESNFHRRTDSSFQINTSAHGGYFDDALRKNDSSPPFSIFYNIFIPPENATRSNLQIVENALKIVEEQLDQIGNSYAVSLPGKPVIVFYNTIGNSHALNATWMEDKCEHQHNMRCHFMQHYDKGSEEVTLSRLYEYCRARPTHRVTYLHSKGSFHPRPANTPWRQALTQAATHQDCLNPPDSSCNVCGLQFYPVCAIEFPGNMWTAKCDYVEQLRPPQGFDVHFGHALTQAHDSNLFTTSFLPLLNICLGTDRYALEHWIATHPTLQPCDMSVAAMSIQHWFRPLKQPIESLFHFHMSPRLPMRSPKFQQAKFLLDEPMGYAGLLRNKTLRLHEYLFLGGNIFRWYKLYGQAPPHDSWTWKWFPDGKLWRTAVERYGENATWHVLNKLDGSTDIRPLREIPSHEMNELEKGHK